jgi:NAD(P)-dependent dehydrogenase (short-subunit alcohol dehydrogenase family)
MPDPRVIFVTGSTSGFGRAIALALHARGDRVFGAARKPEAAPADFPQLVMDVTDEAAVEASVARVVEQAGRLDAVINSAGWGIAGAVEDTTPAEAMAQLDVNFLGVHRVCRAVLPRFRAQGHGRVVNVSSLAGLVPLPFQAFYCASKFALEAYSQALRLEVRRFGIEVCLVEPGDYATGFTASRQRTRASLPEGPYAAAREAALQVMERDERANPDLRPVVRTVLSALDTRRPRLRWPTATFDQRVLVALAPFVPARLAEWVLAKTYRVA